MKIKSSFGISLLVSLFVAACSDNSSTVSVPQESSCSEAIVSSSSEISSSSSIESSSAESSSSEVSSSSFYVEKHLAWDYLNPAISYGEFTDNRDDRVYKYIEYKRIRVMAENMNYSDSIASPNLKGSTWCAYDNLDSCSKYGRLYTWTAAMNLDSSYNVKKYDFGIYPRYQGICPEGWIIYASRDVWQNYSFGNVEDGILCSIKGWPYLNCSDSIGFSALPNGHREEGVMHRLDSAFTYWTLIFDNGDKASLGGFGMWDDHTYWNAVSMSKKIGSGVRCMQMIISSSSVGENSSSSLE